MYFSRDRTFFGKIKESKKETKGSCLLFCEILLKREMNQNRNHKYTSHADLLHPLLFRVLFLFSCDFFFRNAMYFTPIKFVILFIYYEHVKYHRSLCIWLYIFLCFLVLTPLLFSLAIVISLLVRHKLNPLLRFMQNAKHLNIR